MQHLEEGLLHALLDGEIPSTELPPIEAHLAGCEECRARLEQERALRDEADGLVMTLEPPAAGTEPAPGLPRARARPRGRWMRGLAWAASVVAAAGLGFASRRAPRPAPERRAVMANQEASRVKPTAPPPAAPQPAVDAGKLPANADREAPALMRPSTERKDQPAKEHDKFATPAEKKAVHADALDSTGRREVAQGGAVSAASGMVAGRIQLRDGTRIPDSASLPRQAALPPALTPAPAARKLGDEKARLEEIVVTGVPSAAPVATSMAKTEVGAESISFLDAITRLGGTLRLVEGLVPIRVEALGPRIRVVYPLGRRELYLEQWRTANGVSWSLSAPGGLPADSLEQLKARVRE